MKKLTPHEMMYLVFLVIVTLGAIACLALLVAKTSTSVKAERMDFNFEKWYDAADDIKSEYNFPIIAGEDDVFNPDNYEWLVELCFNKDIYPDNFNPVELQYLFIERYYDSCYNVTKDWYLWYKDYKGY
jgi:hypothetical protein